MKLSVSEVAALLAFLPFSVLGQDGFPPEVTDLTTKYEKVMAEAEEPLMRLRRSYEERLGKLKEETRAAGDLNSLILIQEELEKISSGEPGSGSDHASIAELQEIFHRHASLAGPAVYAKKARIESAYGEQLNGLVRDLTKQGKVEAAVEVDRLAKASRERQGKWKLLEQAIESPGDPFAGFDWERVSELIVEGRIEETSRFGGNPQNNETTRDLPSTPSVLVGFDLYLGPFGGSDETVRSMVPLFRTEEKSHVEGLVRSNAKGERRRRILAKEGYALVEIESHSEAGIRKVKFAFEKVSGLGTTSRDRYETDWYGDWDGGRVAKVATDGRLAVGVDGWVGLGVGETWLLVLDP